MMVMSRSLLTLVLVVLYLMSGQMSMERDFPAADGVSPASKEALSLVQGADFFGSLDEYLNTVKEQSDLIGASLENDPLTQTEMNLKSEELSKLWDEALNRVLEELEKSLPEEEFAHLQQEQSIWKTNRETLSTEAGKGFEGGSIYPLIVNLKAAELTEERVYELYALQKTP